MEQTYISWAMVLIGLGAASSGGVGLFLPVGQRLAVALALVLGAGVGIASVFGLQLAGRFGDPESVALAFLISSGVGFAAVLIGLAILVRRARVSSPNGR
jgi:hypothetical protein